MWNSGTVFYCSYTSSEAMAEKRPADSGPEEAITDIEEAPKRPRHKELTEAEQ
jgi:hypothetical protein